MPVAADFNLNLYERKKGKPMGWWNPSESSEITTGDAALDTVRHFLLNFTKTFQDDLSRKPTLSELEYALNLSFKVNLDDQILAGFEELEAKQVTIKTSKRKKRQKVTPGDIFAYKLEDGRFGFGRIVTNVSVGSIAEVFDYFSNQPIFDHSKKKKWLIPPVPIESYGLLEIGSIGDWRIIEHDPEFRPGDEFKSLLYVYGSPPNALTATDIYGNRKAISEKDAVGLPRYYGHDDVNFKKLIESQLASRG